MDSIESTETLMKAFGSFYAMWTSSTHLNAMLTSQNSKITEITTVDSINQANQNASNHPKIPKNHHNHESPPLSHHKKHPITKTPAITPLDTTNHPGTNKEKPPILPHHHESMSKPTTTTKPRLARPRSPQMLQHPRTQLQAYVGRLYRTGYVWASPRGNIR